MALDSDSYDYIHFNETQSSETEYDIKISELHYPAAVNSLIFLISLPANSFLLWVLWTERAWKITSDILLLQLTVSNLCFTVTLPFAACNALHRWVFGEWACGVGTGIYFLGLFTTVVILTAMFLHYYVTVVQPWCLSAQALGKYGVLIGSIVMWLVCAAASIKLAVSGRVIEIADLKVCVNLVESLTMKLTEIYTQIFLFFLIPVLITSFCYVHMWIMAKQGRINSQQQPSKLILGVTVSTFLCLAPYSIHMFIQTLLLLDFYEYTHELIYAWFVIHPITHIYCCFIPLVHLIGVQRFRRYLPMPCNTLYLCRDETKTDSPMALIPLQNAEEI
ncbi:septin 4 [Sarotherodon galilaeus]